MTSTKKICQRIAMVATLSLPLIGLYGCQDNSGLERDVSALKQQVAQLHAAPGKDTEGKTSASGASDAELKEMNARLDRAVADLEAANKKIKDLEARPAAAPVKTGETPAATDPAFKEAVGKAVTEIQAEEKARRDAERKKQQEEQTAQMAKIAEENGIPFDKNDVRGSIQKIMGDPELRAKAMQVMRAEADKRRFEGVGLDERQIEQVKTIEQASRDKMMESIQGARESGASQEEIAAQMSQINKDQEAELKKVMTEEQYKKYQDNGGAMGGMIPGGMGGLGGMIPGMGGGGGFGGGRGGR